MRYLWTMAASKGSSQRKVMKDIWLRCGGDEAAAVAEYARMETAGEVNRGRNSRAVSALTYARKLLMDGKRKGWLKG